MFRNRNLYADKKYFLFIWFFLVFSGKPSWLFNDPVWAADIRPQAALKLFHSGRVHQCCRVNEDSCCQVWMSQLEWIHWPRLCLITFVCAWNIRHPILIWHPHRSIGWHLKSTIVGPAGKQVEHRAWLQYGGATVWGHVLKRPGPSAGGRRSTKERRPRGMKENS